MESGPCDVCVLDCDGDGPSFCSEKVVKARKQHTCCECREKILPGQKYESCTGKWEGDMRTYKTCLLCVEIRNKFSCGNGWMFEGVWESIREGLFDRMTTGCLAGLSMAAKGKLVDAWRRWKGFA